MDTDKNNFSNLVALVAMPGPEDIAGVIDPYCYRTDPASLTIFNIDQKTGRLVPPRSSSKPPNSALMRARKRPDSAGELRAHRRAAPLQRAEQTQRKSPHDPADLLASRTIALDRPSRSGRSGS